MNNNLIALMTSAIVADIIVSEIIGSVIEEDSITLAQILLDNGIDLDFILVVAGANRGNLKEVSKLASEELNRIMQNPQEIDNVSSNNGNKR